MTFKNVYKIKKPDWRRVNLEIECAKCTNWPSVSQIQRRPYVKRLPKADVGIEWIPDFIWKTADQTFHLRRADVILPTLTKARRF